MSKLLATLTVGLVVPAALAACSRDADPPAAGPATDPAAEDPSPTCDPELDAALGRWAEAGFSGTVATSTGGEVDCLAAYGLADEAAGTPNTVDTVFSIGSITKAFTAAAVFDLVDQGGLSLDDRAGDLLPDLGGPVAEATVEQLLHHTSGLTGSHGEDHEPLSRDEAVAALGRLELAFEPGTHHLYSNAGYTLLALIVEEVSGTTYREHTASRVLPLPDGRTAGGFWDGEPTAPGPRAVGELEDGSTGEMGDFAGPHWALDGNGGLAMTTGDLMTWTGALFAGEIVSPESARAIATPGVDIGGGPAESPGWVVYDASVMGETVLISAGGGGDVGHDAVVAWLPESERVVAAASNGPDLTAEDLLAAVGPAWVAGDPLPVPDVPAEEPLDPAELGSIVGTYTLDTGGSFEVTAPGDRLAISATGADAVAALFPPSGGFTTDDVARHQQQVLDLLAGATPAGRDEREALEADIGSIDGVELAGTVVADGELRTYVDLATASGTTRGWYALDDAGGVGAAAVDVEPPALDLVPAGEGRYRPDDPTGTGPDVTVEIGDGRLTVTGPDGGTTEARTS